MFHRDATIPYRFLCWQLIAQITQKVMILPCFPGWDYYPHVIWRILIDFHSWATIQAFAESLILFDQSVVQHIIFKLSESRRTRKIYSTVSFLSLKICIFFSLKQTLMQWMFYSTQPHHTLAATHISASIHFRIFVNAFLAIRLICTVHHLLNGDFAARRNFQHSTHKYLASGKEQWRCHSKAVNFNY